MASPEIPDRELTFGETACARSEKLLMTQGERRLVDGEERVAYEWKVGWEYHRRFVVSRLPEETVSPATIYHLQFEELNRGMGDGGYCDFSQTAGILAMAGIASSFDRLTATEKGLTVPELHQQIVLDMLASEARKDTGF